MLGCQFLKISLFLHFPVFLWYVLTFYLKQCTVFFSELLTYMYYLLNVWNETPLASQNKLYVQNKFPTKLINSVRHNKSMHKTGDLFKYMYKYFIKSVKKIVKTFKMSLKNKQLNSRTKMLPNINTKRMTQKKIGKRIIFFNIKLTFKCQILERH